MEQIKHLVGAHVASSGKGAKTISKEAGLGETAVRDIIKGYSKDVRISTLEALAKTFNVPLSDLLPSDLEPVAIGQKLYVKGAVQAGIWKEAFEWAVDDWMTFTGRADVSADREHRFGLIVRGDSMDLVYPEGTIIECVSLFGRAEVMHGKRVIVLRTSVDGFCEATVKKLVENDGRLWLVAESRNPAYAPIPLDEAGPEIREQRIIAVVVGFYRSE